MRCESVSVTSQPECVGRLRNCSSGGLDVFLRDVRTPRREQAPCQLVELLERRQRRSSHAAKLASRLSAECLPRSARSIRGDRSRTNSVHPEAGAWPGPPCGVASGGRADPRHHRRHTHIRGSVRALAVDIPPHRYSCTRGSWSSHPRCGRISIHTAFLEQLVIDRLTQAVAGNLIERIPISMKTPTPQPLRASGSMKSSWPASGVTTTTGSSPDPNSSIVATGSPSE